MDRKAVGRLGEDIACAALVQRGYEVLERNWRCSVGEVDIVARADGCLVFAEVKTRRGRAAGLPEDALTPTKANRLTNLAQEYLAQAQLGEVTWRIDLVAVELDHLGRVRRLDVYPGVAAD